MSPSEELSIFDGIRHDDRQAFERVFRESYRPLTAYAFRFVKDLPSAENIVQDVYLKLWQNRHELMITTSLVHYLFRSVKNQSINHLNKVKIRSEYTRMQIAEDSIPEDFNAFYPEIGLLDKIESSISALPEKRQKIFRLSREEGLKYHEIAERLDISIKTVETQMTLALKQLRESLKDYHHLVLFFMPADKGISAFGCQCSEEGLKTRI
ncbi:MAG: RNA polymerase sigma-70 factor [Bacteroidetes bacterium]|nr:RNA polymerase sigma-70 factor [Bacteroidota bacterium]